MSIKERNVSDTVYFQPYNYTLDSRGNKYFTDMSIERFNIVYKYLVDVFEVFEVSNINIHLRCGALGDHTICGAYGGDVNIFTTKIGTLFSIRLTPAVFDHYDKYGYIFTFTRLLCHEVAHICQHLDGLFSVSGNTLVWLGEPVLDFYNIPYSDRPWEREADSLAAKMLLELEGNNGFI